MENREYFFHKRKAMLQQEEVQVSDLKNAEKHERDFYDQKMGTSCNLDQPRRGSKNTRGRAKHFSKK
jgi:hypothetical protein